MDILDRYSYAFYTLGQTLLFFYNVSHNHIDLFASAR